MKTKTTTMTKTTKTQRGVVRRVFAVYAPTRTGHEQDGRWAWPGVATSFGPWVVVCELRAGAKGLRWFCPAYPGGRELFSAGFPPVSSVEEALADLCSAAELRRVVDNVGDRRCAPPEGWYVDAAAARRHGDDPARAVAEVCRALASYYTKTPVRSATEAMRVLNEVVESFCLVWKRDSRGLCLCSAESLANYFEGGGDEN